MLAFVAPGRLGGDFYYSATGISAEPATTRDIDTRRHEPPGNGTRDILAAATSSSAAGDASSSGTRSAPTDDVARLLPRPRTTRSASSSSTSRRALSASTRGRARSTRATGRDLQISAAPAPTGRIVFESNRDGDLEIYSMNPDGSAPTRLTEQPDDGQPAVDLARRDEGRLLERPRRRSDIYVMNIDGSGVTQLTTDAGLDLQPAWSPDGTKIAYTAAASSSRHLRHERGRDGTPERHQHRRRTKPAPRGRPTARRSPSPRTGTATTRSTGRTRTAPGTATRLTNNPARRPRSRLVARRAEARVLQRPHRAACSDRSGRSTRPTARIRRTSRTRPIFDADPAWSPDGTHIAFVRDAGGQNFNVWTALADGTDQVNLTPHRRRGTPSPTGARPPRAESATISIAGPGELGPGRRLGRDRGHPARRDPRRDGDDGRRAARRHPARRHPARRHPARRHPARRHPARRHRLHGGRT